MACSCSNSSSSSSSSSCDTSCSTCSCTPNNPISVYAGSSFAPIIRLQDENGIPIDTTPYTEIEVIVCGIAPAAPVSVKFTLAQVLKISPNSSGQIQPLFTGANTLLFGPTDPTQAADCVFTSLTVKLTDPTNPAQNPFVLVIPNVLNILAAVC